MAGTNYNHDAEKDVPLHIDDVETSEKDLVQKDTPEGADYTGAVAKTDPAEIALVRKLDMRVMPALFVMYFLYETLLPLPHLSHRYHITNSFKETSWTKTQSQMPASMV